MTQRTPFALRYKDFMPPGAGALFLIQIFATLAFSVLYSTLILYATKGLGMSDLLATSITGSFVALNYFLHLFGGYVGGRFFSYRSLFAIGMVFQVMGCLLISIPNSDFLLWGLSTFLGGSGLNFTCINCMITQLFEPHDKRRETAFLWNYSGMNIGFFIGFSIGGYFHLNQSYRELFLLSGLGNLIAIILTLYNWKSLRDRATTFVEASYSSQKKSQVIGAIIIIGLVFTIRMLLEKTNLCNQLIMIIGTFMLVFITIISLQQNTTEKRNKIWAYIILSLASVIFWALYQLAPMGLNLFIDRNVDRHFLGFIIAPQWVQNINTLVIIFGGPILSIVFTYLRERGTNLNIPFQFSLALILIGIAFAILPIGIRFADVNGYVNFNWILLCYILQSTGELFISPIGYAMIGELAPLNLRGLMMGMWMMISGISAILSNHFSKLALGSVETTNPLVTNAGYSHTFGILGWTTISIGIILFLLVPIVTRLTYEKKALEPGDNLARVTD